MGRDLGMAFPQGWRQRFGLGARHSGMLYENGGDPGSGQGIGEQVGGQVATWLGSQDRAVLHGGHAVGALARRRRRRGVSRIPKKIASWGAQRRAIRLTI